MSVRGLVKVRQLSAFVIISIYWLFHILFLVYWTPVFLHVPVLYKLTIGPLSTYIMKIDFNCFKIIPHIFKAIICRWMVNHLHLFVVTWIEVFENLIWMYILLKDPSYHNWGKQPNSPTYNVTCIYADSKRLLAKNEVEFINRWLRAISIIWKFVFPRVI